LRVTGLPAALEYVGEYAFRQTDLHTVTALPAGISHVGQGAFESCMLETLTVPGTLKTIRSMAFVNNPLRELVLEEGVETLEPSSVVMSSGRIVLPKTVTSVEQFWVYDSSEDLTICCAAEGPVGDLLRANEMGFYDLDTGEYCAMPYKVNQGGVNYRVYPGHYAEVLSLDLGAPADLIIPAQVEGLPVEAVSDWALSSDSLRSIELPDTVRRIAEYAMTDSTNLQRLRLPEGLKSFDSQCIMNCYQLHVLYIPASVTEIKENYLKFDRILLVEPGSYAEDYARTHECVFVPVEEGTQYVSEGLALCRVAPEGAVLVGLVSGEDENGTPYYEAPDTVAGLPVVGIDGGAVFGGSARTMQDLDTRIDLVLGSNVEWIAPGALDGSGIRGLYTFPALRELPEDLFACAGDRPVEIGGFYGSYAQDYAQARGIPFVILDGTPFTDVPRESWFFAPVFVCYRLGLMVGTSATTFSPNSNASRAMLVTVLWRMSGSPLPVDAHFEDVPFDSWYYGAVNWAAENGVVYGVGQNRFAPNQSITREQTAAILFRLAAAAGYPVDSFAPLGGFRDASEASDYARSALMWAVDAGIMQGNDRHELRPRGTATRAELAAMLVRFIAWCEMEMEA
ncbi:MAG: S-layer homology domain-containing protein, partial [Oscillospiraceae bacterium]|nr:S-layer homology domain-containing protein [Oscillospiraceae bacterium]